jgi:hypothetical protein
VHRVDFFLVVRYNDKPRTRPLFLDPSVSCTMPISNNVLYAIIIILFILFFIQTTATGLMYHNGVTPNTSLWSTNQKNELVLLLILAIGGLVVTFCIIGYWVLKRGGAMRKGDGAAEPAASLHEMAASAGVPMPPEPTKYLQDLSTRYSTPSRD